MAKEPNRPPTLVPDHAVRETFCDTVRAVGFDGANLRVELAVNRIEQSGGERTSTLHPSARLVLPLAATNELIQKLSGALADLEKQGVLRKAQAPGQIPPAGQQN